MVILLRMYPWCVCMHVHVWMGIYLHLCAYMCMYVYVCARYECVLCIHIIHFAAIFLALASVTRWRMRATFCLLCQSSEHLRRFEFLLRRDPLVSEGDDGVVGDPKGLGDGCEDLFETIRKCIRLTSIV